MFVNLVKSNDREIVFKRSMPVRNAILLILVAIDSLCYLYFAEQIRVTPVGENEYVWCVPILLVVVINFYLLRFAGPNDLVLNIDRQSYTRTTGYPMFPRVVSGSFGDFYGLCIRGTKNRRQVVVSHRVELDWNTPDHKPLVLAETVTFEEAFAEQRELARRLGSIPVEKD